MELAEFELQRATFELRYQKAFALWDHAGLLTQALTAQYPKAQLQDANPGRISLIVKPDIEFVVELEKAFAIKHSPNRTAEDLIALATALTKTITASLEVNAFTRIGTRVIYGKKYDKVSAATERLLSLGRLKLPEGKFFGVQSAPQSAMYTARWEGKATGVRLLLQSQTQKIEFSPSPAYAKEVQPVDKEQHELVLDIDYFSTEMVMSEQFRAEDWIKNVVHMINRDTHVFLRPL